MVREAGGDSIRIRCAFAVALACVLVEFSKAASAAEIYEMYKAWPLVHAKKERQKAGAPSTSRWWRKSSSWWGASGSSWCETWEGSNKGWGERADDSRCTGSISTTDRRRERTSSSSSV